MVLGGTALAACGRRARLLELTTVPTPVSLTRPAPTPVSPTQPAPTPAPGGLADTILVNGNIVTIDAKRTTAKALAIKDGVIQLVADDQSVRAMAGDGTRVIDLGGRTVTPGLIDAHCHLSACGLLGTAYVDISWPARMPTSQGTRKAPSSRASWPI